MSELPSWNDTSTRHTILSFVDAVTADDSDEFLPPEERVAVFDNDGTLWCEKPMPVELDFNISRMAARAEAEPSLRDVQPWKAAYEKDYAWLGAAMVKHYHGDDGDLKLLTEAIPQAFGSVTVEAFAADVVEFFRHARHPTLGRTYLEATYRPMVELLRYLEANGFATYIASGGSRDFMRPIAHQIYGIPPERVIGTSLVSSYQADDDGTYVRYEPRMEFFDDGPTKPVRIWSRVGRRPVLAVGNSNGDVEMMRFARTDTRPALRLLVVHDDPEREFDYTSGAEAALDRAHQRDWTMVSMRDDWSVVFADA